MVGRLVALAPLAATALVGGAAAAETDAVECRGELGAVEVDAVVVPRHAFCRLHGTRVVADVVVLREATLHAREASVGGDVAADRDADARVVESRIGRDVTCDACFSVYLLESTVGRNVRLVGPREGRAIVGATIGRNLDISGGTAIELGYAVSANTIAGDVRLENNAGPMSVRRNTVGGDLDLADNRPTGSFCFPPDTARCLRVRGNRVGGDIRVLRTSALSELVGNTAGDRLACFGNTPPPVGGANIAPRKDGQCRAL
jgi:phosphotransferase system HPr-like phosphotransfer protein